MAGEFEEPFQLSFQGDSLHSGSISFGRFEGESLSWERRSSFSHNRYLEEVEKYSKPGSVTEKKAYFEAHFKKKALLSQTSSESQNGAEHSSENDKPQNIGALQEFEIVNEDSHFNGFEESTQSWEYVGESEVAEGERVDGGVLYPEPQAEPAIDEFEVIEPEEAQITENGNLLVISTEPEMEEGVNDEVVHVDVTSEVFDTSPCSHRAEKYNNATSGHQRILSTKVKTTSETKPTKSRSKSLASVTQVQRAIYSEASGRKPISVKTRTEKKLSQTAAPTTGLIGRTSKLEDFTRSKVKVIPDNRSEKDLRAKKVVESQSLSSEKFVPGRQSANRPKTTASSTKTGMKPSAVVFNFKSNERAEKRKQYLTMLEEKMHAKEAEMNQIQAKAKEKKEAEIKQFQKSLNFKATPMPCFYHESIHGSDRNKAVAGNTKSSNQGSNSRTEPLNAPDPPEIIVNNELTDKEKHKNSLKQRVPNGSNVLKGQRVATCTFTRLKLDR